MISPTVYADERKYQQQRHDNVVRRYDELVRELVATLRGYADEIERDHCRPNPPGAHSDRASLITVHLSAMNPRLRLDDVIVAAADADVSCEALRLLDRIAPPDRNVLG